MSGAQTHFGEPDCHLRGLPSAAGIRSLTAHTLTADPR